jgi:hypothetical protein
VWVAYYNSDRPHSSLKYLTRRPTLATFNATGDQLRNPRPAPPIARCSTCATRCTNLGDSNCHWMKIQWQVKMSLSPSDIYREK